jgi:hypothetical protein
MHSNMIHANVACCDAFATALITTKCVHILLRILITTTITGRAAYKRVMLAHFMGAVGMMLKNSGMPKRSMEYAQSVST